MVIFFVKALLLALFASLTNAERTLSALATILANSLYLSYKQTVMRKNLHITRVQFRIDF